MRSTSRPAAPKNFLREMVAQVRQELAEGYYARRPSSPIRRGRQVGPRPSLVRSLRPVPGEPVAVMVELKHASPGYGEAPLRALPPTQFVDVSQAAGANALSVIPQPYAFRGDLAEFGQVAEMAHAPVLFKDFVIDKAQIRAASAWGATGVLLLARLEMDGGLNVPLAELVQDAHDLEMEVLLELHSRAEVPIALRSKADVLGVNARDLASLKLDPRSAIPVLRTLQGDPRPRVGMSGISGPAGVSAYVEAGATAILVGTAFSQAPDPAAFLRTLRRSS